MRYLCTGSAGTKADAVLHLSLAPAEACRGAVRHNQKIAGKNVNLRLAGMHNQVWHAGSGSSECQKVDGHNDGGDLRAYLNNQIWTSLLCQFLQQLGLLLHIQS